MNSTTGLPEQWDKTADVVVIGYGGAGAIAAITAADAGARVIVLEKSPALAGMKLTGVTGPIIEISGGGGDTHISTGSIVAPTNAADAANYLYTASGGQTPMDVCVAWAEEVCKNEAWFQEMGINGGIDKRRVHTEYPNLPGASAMTQFHVLGNGPTFFAKLDKHVQNRGIEVIFDTPGKDLIRNYVTGDIVGVVAEQKGKTITVKARKGVILCTGGFAFNEEMKNRFLKIWPMKFYGWTYNTGDGIKMAQKVGADLWHMDVVCGGNCAWFDDPQYKFGFSVRTKTNSYIWVNKYGSRFCNEFRAAGPHGGWVIHMEINDKVVGFSRVPSYLIFDEEARTAAPIGVDDALKGGLPMGHILLPLELEGYEGWSQDNLKEIEKGWIKKGETIEALAANIGADMDAARLKAAIETFNNSCAAGKDAEFGRDPDMMRPIDNPPYYAVPLYPGLVTTIGGPMRSAKGEVLDPDRKPIPRLYEAGSCGSIFGRQYSVTGGNMGDVCAFGRIAGRNAAALDSWE